MSEETTISLKKKTRDKLKKMGRKGQSYDTLINLLLNHYENCLETP